MSDADVHVDWHMTLAEWDELRGVLIRNTGYEYIGRLEAAGALKRPLSSRDGAAAEPQPAPELAAAMAETRKVAEAALVVLDAFTKVSDGYRARLSGVTLMRAYKAIGRPVPDRLRHLDGQ